KVFHRGGCFGGDGLDHFQHFGGGFAEVGIPFAGKDLPVARAPGGFSPLGNVDRHFAEETELHQTRLRISIDQGVSINLNSIPRFVFRFSWIWRRTWTCRRTFLRRREDGGCFFSAAFFFARPRRE